MSKLCETKTCRRKYLLNYFGEEAPAYCGSCDVCLNEQVLKDATVISQKILSAVTRLKEKFGMRYIVDILRGSNNEKIREEHKQLSVFGIGKDVAKEEWMHYIKELIHFDYLIQTEGQYPILQLTDKARDVLFKKEQVYLTEPVRIEIAKEPVIYQQHSYEKELFDSLKQLRNKIAHEENMPAYIIFSDSTLMDLATYLPLSFDDLSKVSGFGAFKIEKYGKQFLEPIQDYCNQHQIESRIYLKQPKRERKQKPPIVKERPSETKRLSLEMFNNGMTFSEIAEARNLSQSTVETHLSSYVISGELEIDNIVAKAKQKRIRTAVSSYGSSSLKVLKENLPPEISYGEIKMVLASMQNENAEQ
jgi:ATP-dependent DNA helicase RecQ